MFFLFAILSFSYRREALGLPFPPTVVFFAFGEKTGLPVLRRKMHRDVHEAIGRGLDDRTWAESAKATICAVVAFARQSPEVRVVVKTKKGHSDTVRAALAVDGAERSDNVEVIEGSDPLRLLELTWAVVGMNTTAILEALAMGTIVLTPSYAEAAESQMRIWLADYGEAVEEMKTPEQMVARLAEICRGQPLQVVGEFSPAAAATLHSWAGNSDGPQVIAYGPVSSKS